MRHGGPKSHMFNTSLTGQHLIISTSERDVERQMKYGGPL